MFCTLFLINNLLLVKDCEVVFSKNLYKILASQIYRHYKNCVKEVLVLNNSAEGPNYTFNNEKCL